MISLQWGCRVMQQNRSNHVLCVEDSRDTCQLLEVALPQLRFTFASTFGSGLEFAKRGVFDLYLLDNWLPGGTGIELCRAIRNIDLNAPIVFLSAACYPADHQAASSAGATAYIDKPLDLFTLESTLIGLIRRAERSSLDAKMAEVAALRDEIKQQLGNLDARMKTNAQMTLTALDHLFRARAYATFIHCGGIRAHFEQLWPEVLDSLVSI